MPIENLKAFQARKHQRTGKEVKVVLCVKGVCGTSITKDISDGGLALNLATAENLPEVKVGSIVSTREESDSQTTAKVGRVVRLSDTELAVEYC